MGEAVGGWEMGTDWSISPKFFILRSSPPIPAYLLSLFIQMQTAVGSGQPHWSSLHSANVRSRNALVMTDTELKVIAALAIIGLSNSPKTG